MNHPVLTISILIFASLFFGILFMATTESKIKGFTLGPILALTCFGIGVIIGLIDNALAG